MRTSPCFPTGVRRFLRDEAGTTAIEYALIGSIISIAIAGTAYSLGESLRDDLFGKVGTAFEQAGKSPPTD